MSELSKRECFPCKGAIPPLRGESLMALHKKLGSQWNIIHEHHLEKEFKFRNFKEALEFTQKIGNLAEKQQHHPEIHLGWGFVRVTIWTHKIDGLTESDFILAAKIEAL